MPPSLVVVPPPALDGDASIGQAREPAFVQTLVAESAVEALGVCVLHRFPRLDEVQRDTALVCPLVKYLPSELRRIPCIAGRPAWPIITHDAFRQPSDKRESVQDTRDAFACERGIDFCQ